MNYEIPHDDFKSKNYVEINHKRFEHFSSLNISLTGKNIIELGAGIGDHTENLLKYRPCSITCIESRAENLYIFRDRFENENRVEAIEMDLENPVDLNKVFDICYCYGLLYHISNPDVLIEYMARHTSGVLFLETCVDYKNEDTVNLVSEDQKLFSQSFSGKGCRPGRKWIFNELKKYFEHVYMPLTQPDHAQFPTAWTLSEIPNALTRSIFVASTCKLENDLLCGKILYNQKYLREINC